MGCLSFTLSQTAVHSETAIVETEQYKDAFSQLQQVETAWKDGN